MKTAVLNRQVHGENNMNYEPFKIVFGQVVRHFVSIASAALATYGVTEAMQNELVEASVAIAIAVAAFLVTQAWAYISKIVAFQTPTDEEP